MLPVRPPARLLRRALPRPRLPEAQLKLLPDQCGTLPVQVLLRLPLLLVSFCIRPRLPDGRSRWCRRRRVTLLRKGRRKVHLRCDAALPLVIRLWQCSSSPWTGSCWLMSGRPARRQALHETRSRAWRMRIGRSLLQQTGALGSNRRGTGGRASRPPQTVRRWQCFQMSFSSDSRLRPRSRTEAPRHERQRL